MVVVPHEIVGCRFVFPRTRLARENTWLEARLGRPPSNGRDTRTNTNTNTNLDHLNSRLDSRCSNLR
jgi:hypothetical protein